MPSSTGASRDRSPQTPSCYATGQNPA